VRLAPIVLFAYDRPNHLRQTVDALRRNELADQSELFVFADGPKPGADGTNVRAVREYLRELEGFRSVQVIRQDENLGLAQSIIDGVTRICRSHGRVIVVEDDMVTSPYFLRFMNDGLELYEKQPEVISIHGFVGAVAEALPETFFLRGADCWGWATWQRGWDLFDPDGRSLLAALEERQLTRSFDFDGAFGYTDMLRQQIAGTNSSWAIRWHASAFLHERLTLYPFRSLVQNIGHDGSGTHCGESSEFEVQLADRPVVVSPQPIAENPTARRIIASHLRGLQSPPARRRWWSFLTPDRAR